MSYITSWILARPGKPLAKQYDVLQTDLDKLSCVLQPTEGAIQQGLICIYKYDAGAFSATAFKGFPPNTWIFDGATPSIQVKKAAEGTDTWGSIT